MGKAGENDMNSVLEKIEKTGIIPVVTLEDAQTAVLVGAALQKGGISCAEVTFRTKEAAECLQALSEQYPQMLLGAGTVLTTQQVDEAVRAGAEFIVSPGLNPRIVRHCIERGITIIPGCANPSDVEQAIENGLEAVKFFPAEAAGGLAMIKAMSAPYSQVRYMPTGGIDQVNLKEYLQFPKVIACGGSWMVKRELIQDGNWQRISELCREASAIVGEARRDRDE